jgi:hypothetical protein
MVKPRTAGLSPGDADVVDVEGVLQGQGRRLQQHSGRDQK